MRRGEREGWLKSSPSNHPPIGVTIGRRAGPFAVGLCIQKELYYQGLAGLILNCSMVKVL
jgi:hypothetical protein